MEKKTIEYYTRYVDDILIIYNTDHTNMETIFHYINSIHPNLTFTPTQEHNKTISSLDLHITRKKQHIRYQHLQKTYNHGHHHQLLLQPPNRTKTGCIKILNKQNALAPPDTNQ